MKKLIFSLILVSTLLDSSAQKNVCEKSRVSFYSHATIEDITAYTQKTAAIFNISEATIAFSIPISSFQFEKSLMKEHFNEKYMESDKYPKSTFEGKIDGFDSNMSGIRNVNATGKLTIHGVTREVNIPGTIEKSNDKYLMKAKFIVRLADYQIEIPQLLWQNIAEQVEVTAEFTFKNQ